MRGRRIASFVGNLHWPSRYALIARQFRFRATSLGLAIAVVIGSPRPASAQYRLGYVHPLFVFATRDPISTDTASTARSLALGGAHAISGLADDALSCPASLLRTSGTDIVFSGGPFQYSRAEPAATPSFLFGQAGGFFNPVALQVAGSSIAPVGYAAIATRRSWWAVAAFLDATDRYQHLFDTTSSVVGANQSGHSAFLRVTATGSAAVSESMTRIGGALAIAPIKNRVALGIALYHLHLQYTVAANLSETWRGDLFPAGPVAANETENIEFDGWQPGWVLSASVRVVPPLSVLARWQKEPQFGSIRNTVRLPVSPPTPQPSYLEPALHSAAAQIQLPDTLGIGATFALKNTLLVVEFARISYGDLFQPVSMNCSSLMSPDCPGWGWSETLSGKGFEALSGNKLVGTSNALVGRGGLEQSLPVGRGNLRLRGGLAIEQGHALAEALPSYAPPPPTAPGVGPEYPAREDVTTWSAGVGYEWSKMEVAASLATGSSHTRVLVDLRVRLP